MGGALPSRPVAEQDHKQLLTNSWLLLGGNHCGADQWQSRTTKVSSLTSWLLVGGTYCGADQWRNRATNSGSLTGVAYGQGPLWHHQRAELGALPGHGVVMKLDNVCVLRAALPCARSQGYECLHTLRQVVSHVFTSQTTPLMWNTVRF